MHSSNPAGGGPLFSSLWQIRPTVAEGLVPFDDMIFAYQNLYECVKMQQTYSAHSKDRPDDSESPRCSREDVQRTPSRLSAL
ncbi:unnamed protein product [Protopolystoma xenopodis]|uniref:Uncharacterized protein n=1 Tax=Protopolystoma xenopodis TaxID=117903 RepID=A0A3S5BQZ8_9PLAT|nr:unnamed protein product [Protopolystoma xenopodis]